MKNGNMLNRTIIRVVPAITDETELLRLANEDERVYIIADARAFQKLTPSLQGSFFVLVEGQLEHRRPVLLLCNRECSPGRKDDRIK